MSLDCQLGFQEKLSCSTHILYMQGRKRQMGGTRVPATIGNASVVCQPEDDPCNGPLQPGARYRIRYQLFSGDEFADYDFFDMTYATGS